MQKSNYELKISEEKSGKSSRDKRLIPEKDSRNSENLKDNEKIQVASFENSSNQAYNLVANLA